MNDSFTVTINHQVTRLRIHGTVRGGRVIVGKIDIGTRAEEDRAPDVNADHAAVAALVDLLCGYLDGKPVNFDSIEVDTGPSGGFRTAVENAVRRIPYGQTCSYAELAAMAGNPGAVRAAASVVRRNPVPVIVPCHRVIRKNGAVGGYCGSVSGPDVELKKRLLRLEKPLTV